MSRKRFLVMIENPYRGLVMKIHSQHDAKSEATQVYKSLEAKRKARHDPYTQHYVFDREVDPEYIEG